MDSWTAIFLPFALMMARVAGFFAVLPIFGSKSIPMRVRAALALLATIFFCKVTPAPDFGAAVLPVTAIVLICREALLGLALGMVASLVFRGIEMGAKFIGRQMGFATAGILDPTSGERGAPAGMVFQMAFMMLFLAADGHHLLLLVVHNSFGAFPIGEAPDPSLLVGGILQGTAAMFAFGMKLVAPVLAAFIVLSLILGVLARVLPELNVLMMSFPLRVGLGLFMAAAVMPMMNDLTIELAQWMNQNLVT